MAAVVKQPERVLRQISLNLTNAAVHSPGRFAPSMFRDAEGRHRLSRASGCGARELPRLHFVSQSFLPSSSPSSTSIAVSLEAIRIPANEPAQQLQNAFAMIQSRTQTGPRRRATVCNGLQSTGRVSSLSARHWPFESSSLSDRRPP